MEKKIDKGEVVQRKGKNFIIQNVPFIGDMIFVPAIIQWSGVVENPFFKDKNLKEIDPCFRQRHNAEKMLPHTDEHVNYIFLAYLKGEELMYNGTGFYNEDGHLDRYIGFRQNRAIFFNSFICHSDLQSLGKSSPRYTLNIFYKNDEII